MIYLNFFFLIECVRLMLRFCFLFVVFFFLSMDIQFSAPFVENVICLPLSHFCTFVKLSLSFCVGLLLGLLFFSSNTSFPGGSDGKSACLQCGRPRFDPWVRKIVWSRKWQPTPVFLLGKSHGQSLEGYSP